MERRSMICSMRVFVLALLAAGCVDGPGGDGPAALDARVPDVHDAAAPDAAPDTDSVPCGGECWEGACDEATGACVECVTDAHCGPEATRCVENACAACAFGEPGCGEQEPEPPPPPAPPSDEEPPPEPTPDTTPPPPPSPPEEEPPAEPAPEPPEGEAPFRIRFATYNMRTSNLDNSAWRDNHTGWDADDGARMERVADEIVDQELTVVAAQEIRGVERDAVLARLEAHGQTWGYTTHRQPALDDTAVLFLRSAWRKVRETHFLIPLQGDLSDRFQIGVLLEHRETGRAVWFYSVHFAAGGNSGANEREAAARRTVASIREKAIEGRRPFVLGGDFNAVASGPVGDVFRESGFMRYTRGAADRRINDGCKTFNGLAGWEGRQQCPGGEASHIDHVWVGTAGTKVVTYRVTATERTSRASDHNPLTTVPELR